MAPTRYTTTHSLVPSAPLSKNLRFQTFFANWQVSSFELSRTEPNSGSKTRGGGGGIERRANSVRARVFVSVAFTFKPLFILC